jgi:hypothetical protein
MKELYKVSVYGDSFCSFEALYTEQEVNTILKFFDTMSECGVASYDCPLVEFEKKGFEHE